MNNISVTGLSKAYKMYPNKFARFKEWLHPFNKKYHVSKWVLKDINFSIAKGESLGIVGVNGAGKSTLLKIITGTTQPTTGHVEKTGRIAALLELGMGFHPDFTGRQNAIMSAQIQGYSAEEIHAAMPEIERFADIGDYIDQPLRIYSSGMQVRLAFAVATAHRPEILIVDEALSVGDAAFQRKCFQRIEHYRALGTSLIFVTHDTETVKRICDYGLFLNNGGIEYFGEAKKACDLYEQVLFGSKPKSLVTTKTSSTAKLDSSLSISCEMSYGNGNADIESCWLESLNGNRLNTIETGESFNWCYRVKFNQIVTNPIFAMMLKTADGIAIYGVDSTKLALSNKTYLPNQMVEVRFKLKNTLAPGNYYLNCGVRVYGTETVEFLSRRVDAAILRVIEGSSSTALLGLIELHSQLEVKSIE